MAHEEQQPMSEARLAEIAQFVGDLRMIGELGTHNLEHDYVRDLLAEVERLREQNAALSEKLDAEADYNAGHIERLRAREAPLVEVVRAVAEASETHSTATAYGQVSCLWFSGVQTAGQMREQARAALATLEPTAGADATDASNGVNDFHKALGWPSRHQRPGQEW